MKQVTLEIAGMTCAHCVRHVTEALERVRGVRSVEVQLEPGRATLDVERGVVVEHLLEAVEEAGYQARLPQGAD